MRLLTLLGLLACSDTPPVETPAPAPAAVAPAPPAAPEPAVVAPAPMSESQADLVYKARLAMLPPSQRAFCEAVGDGARDYAAATTDDERAAVRVRRGERLAAIGRFDEWRGTVQTIGFTKVGNGVINLRMPCSKFSIGTTNNELTAAQSPGSLVSPDSPVIDSLKTISRGVPVFASGTFLKDDSPDQVKVQAVNAAKSMSGSHFLVAFDKPVEVGPWRLGDKRAEVPNGRGYRLQLIELTDGLHVRLLPPQGDEPLAASMKRVDGTTISGDTGDWPFDALRGAFERATQLVFTAGEEQILFDTAGAQIALKHVQGKDEPAEATP